MEAKKLMNGTKMKTQCYFIYFILALGRCHSRKVTIAVYLFFSFLVDCFTVFCLCIFCGKKIILIDLFAE